MTEKYPDEVCFCAGVAKVRSPVDETISSIQFPLWNYSVKTIVSLKDAITLRNIKIDEVKKTGKEEKWVESQCTPGEFYLDDDVDKVKQIAKQTKRKLHSVGIMTVRHLCDMTQAQLDRVNS